MSTTLPSRRRVLRSAAVAGTLFCSRGLLQTASLFADDPKRKSARVDYCFSLYGMRSLKLAEALKVCAKIGYDGVEPDAGRGQSADPDRLSSADRRDIRKRLADLGLSVPGLMENLALLTTDANHRQNLDRLKAVGELGHDLSPQAPPIIETILGSRPDRWEQEKERWLWLWVTGPKQQRQRKL